MDVEKEIPREGRRGRGVEMHSLQLDGETAKFRLMSRHISKDRRVCE